ncbi:Eukaryotic translation initiation factor 5b [Thalictrum thalictroides]|uniref:Eukaryotic translation initiation factor 5b n=1 Tax=Thalictrum thalictroides TaxID=46969 RepID=A0A7J6W625_THATH|nr:Eukaryotic translation initiation factor 5b [Thalictrum thalictroides]
MAAGTISIVPTSAISGEGIPDLLLLLAKWSQKTMVEKLMFREEVQCTILEVKVTEGFGTTIDVILVNGTLRKGDQIIVCGMHGPIVTTIRALLTPPPMKEIRVKGSYEPHEVIKAAQGIKIAAQGLEHCIPGSGLYVVRPGDNLEDAKEAVMQDMSSVMRRIDKTGEGVCVQASTLGSLEAWLEFLKSPAVNIPEQLRLALQFVSHQGVGHVASIHLNKKPIDFATKGQEVSISIESTKPDEQQKQQYGRHFDKDDELLIVLKRFQLDLDRFDNGDEGSVDPAIVAKGQDLESSKV